MAKKRRTLAERYRRLKRIIRFLSRRGTLFRKKPPEKLPEIIFPARRKNKQWRQWRKIRYLVKRGTLVKKRNPADFTQKSELTGPQKSRSRSSSIYRTYRFLRFLINTNRLFVRKRVKPQPEIRKNKNRTYRKIRYLLRKGSLFKIKPPITGYETTSYFRAILGTTYARIWINSLLLFMLGYCIVFLLANFATSFTALSYEIRSVIYYFKIDYLINAKDWKIDAIKIVYAAGPFFSLLFAIFFLILFINISHETWYFRLLFFWIFCHAFIRFFGEMLIGLMMTKGIGLTVAYLYATDHTKLFLIIISSSVMVSTGLLITKLALFTGNVYFNNIDRKNRLLFLQSQFLIPSVLGTGIIILLKFPRMTDLDLFTTFTVFMIILPIVLRGIRMKDLYFDPEAKDLSIRLWALLAAVLAVVLLRAVFEAGVRIG